MLLSIFQSLKKNVITHRGTSVGNMLKKQNPITDLLCFNSENFWTVHHLLRLITESTCPRQKNISYIAAALLPNKNMSEWIDMQAYRGKVQLEIRLPISNKEVTTSRRNKHLVIQRCTILLAHCRRTMMGITQKTTTTTTKYRLQTCIS